MRLSTQQFFMQNLLNVQRGNAEIFKYQQQVTTGEKLQQPADDPLATTQINKFERLIARNEVFSNNVDVAERRINLEETALTLITDTIQRVKELSIRANNGTLSDNDQAIIAEEMEQQLGQLFSAVNRKDAQGEYLFSGFKGHTQPYQLNDADQYEYKGDDGQRFLNVGEDATIASTDPGGDLFGKGTDNVLNAVKNMVELLRTDPSNMTDFNAEVNKVDAVFEQIVTQRSQLGGRLNVLTDQRDLLANEKLFTQTTLSTIKDADPFEAVSNLVMEQNALEAAYAAFGRTQQLSLFNYIS